ncbi:MAG: hypothetical protein ABI593_10580 [Betaproteobacteria bacterium]
MTAPSACCGAAPPPPPVILFDMLILMPSRAYVARAAIVGALLLFPAVALAQQAPAKTSPKGPDQSMLIGIYEIIDANDKRACWGKPGGPRPTDFTSAPGSGRTLQYWHLISRELGK